MPATQIWGVPQVGIARAGKDPLLAWLLSKARALGLILDNVFDGFPDKASTSSDEHDGGHCSRTE